MLKERLDDVVKRIRSLTALQEELELMIEGCNQGHVANCRVIDVLADHGKNVHPYHYL